jgi:hypothetical protein
MSKALLLFIIALPAHGTTDPRFLYRGAFCEGLLSDENRIRAHYRKTLEELEDVKKLRRSIDRFVDVLNSIERFKNQVVEANATLPPPLMPGHAGTRGSRAEEAKFQDHIQRIVSHLDWIKTWVPSLSKEIADFQNEVRTLDFFELQGRPKGVPQTRVEVRFSSLAWRAQNIGNEVGNRLNEIEMDLANSLGVPGDPGQTRMPWKQ